MSNRTVTVSLRADTSDYARGMHRASALTKGFSQDVDRMHSRSRSSVLSMSRAHAVATTVVTGGLAAIVTSSVRSAASFDTSMRQIAIATGAPATAVKGLSDLAIKMGRDTVFSAQDAGNAMLELAKGGLNEAQIRAGALSSTLTLASAGGLELSDAAGFVVQGLTTFNLKANQAAAVAAALAGGANASTASVQDMGLALSQVGPGALNAGLSLQETTGILAAFANNGIRGSDAGTSLKTMLARLEPQTDKARGKMKQLGLDFTDAEGNFISIDKVAQQLHDRLGGLSDAERTAAMNVIFGSDATRAATVLMRIGGQGVRDYTKATSDRSQAEKLAKAATDGSAGALEQLSGSIDTAKIQLGQALTPLTIIAAEELGDLADVTATKVIPTIADFAKGMQDGTGPGGQFVDVLVGIKDAAGDAWDVASPLFHFVADHPALFSTIAKDALILAGALKGISVARGAAATVTGMLGRGGRGGVLGGAVTAGPVPVFVTNPGFGSGAGTPGAPGAPGSRGSGLRTAVGVGGGAVVGGAMGFAGDPTSASSSATSIAGGAAAGAVVAGPWGAVAGAAAAALVLGFRRGSVQAAKDRATLEAIRGLGNAAGTAIAGGTNPILTESQLIGDLASKGLPTSLAEIEKQLDAIRQRQKENPLLDFDQEIKELEAARTALRQVQMDSLQYDAALKALANSGIAAGKAAQEVRDQAGQVDSDSPSRLAARYSDLVDESRHASDSLRVQERDLGRVSRTSLEAKDSLRALELQLARIRPRSVQVTIDILQQYRTSGKPGSTDPEVRTSVARITAAADYSPVAAGATRAGFSGGGLVSGAGTGTSDSIYAPWVSNGEFVVNAAATAQNLALLQAINSRGVAPANYSYSPPRPADAGAQAVGAVPNVNVPVQILATDGVARDAARNIGREVGLAIKGV